MKIGDVYYEKHTVTEISRRTNTVSETQVERVDTVPQKWIPVSEKLPEDGIYLVTVERTSGVPRIETKSFAKDLHRVDDYDFPEHKCGWYEYDSEYGYWEDTDVIAWQLLPQPYTPQESEDKCKNCKYYSNPDYTRCHECKAERSDKE